MKSCDRDGSENQAIALALLQLAREVLEGRADVHLTRFGDLEWIEYRTYDFGEPSDGVSVTASKAVLAADRAAPMFGREA